MLILFSVLCLLKTIKVTMIFFTILRKSVIPLYNSRIAAFLFPKIFNNPAFFQSCGILSSWEVLLAFCENVQATTVVLVLCVAPLIDLLWPRVRTKPSCVPIIDSIHLVIPFTSAWFLDFTYVVLSARIYRLL